MADGKMRIVVERGGLHLIRDTPESGPPYDLRFNDCVVTPIGTTLDVDWVEDRKILKVLDGKVSIAGGAGDVGIEAGNEVRFPTREVHKIVDPQVDDRFYGWPVSQFPLDLAPVPFGESDIVPGAAIPPRGWRWLAFPPDNSGHNDVLAAGADGELKVTTRRGCGWNRFENLSTGPVLAKGLTGDFDLMFQLALETGATDTAGAQFFVYAPGSNISFDWQRPNQPTGQADDRLDLPGLLRCRLGRLDFVPGLEDAPGPERSGLVWLRLSRRGTKLVTACSTDSVAWDSAPEREAALLPETAWIGLRFEHIADWKVDSSERGTVASIKRIKIRSWPLGAS